MGGGEGLGEGDPGGFDFRECVGPEIECESYPFRDSGSVANGVDDVIYNTHLDFLASGSVGNLIDNDKSDDGENSGGY